MVPLVHQVHAPQQIVHPERAAFGDAEAQAGEALEHPRPQEEPQRPGRPEANFGGVNADVWAVGRLVGHAGVHVHRHLQLLTYRPDRVVHRVVIGLVWLPHRRDEDAAPQSRGVGPPDLGDRLLHPGDNRHQRHPGPALGAGGAQLGQPAVVGRGPGQQQIGRGVGVGAQPRPEGCRGAGGDRVGVGEDHLAHHPVVGQLGVAPLGVPAAPQPLGVLGVPLLGELGVEKALGGHLLLPGPGEDRLVEGLPKLRVEPLAILLVGQAGVAVGRDDQIRVGGQGCSHVSFPCRWVGTGRASTGLGR